MFEGETSHNLREQQSDEAVSVAEVAESNAPSVSGGSGRGGLRLSSLQLEFAREYVINGGNAFKAATLAGYGDPHKSAFRNLLNPAILHEIRRLAAVNVEAYLPIAIRVLVEIACDPSQDGKARIMAANSLLDRGGMRPKSDGPSVQVNVQINGQQAQAAIADVWAAREQRMSAIAGGMSDSIEHAASATITQAAAPRGGEQSQGPVASPALIPPPISEYLPKSPGGSD